jgi:hypothetical protein
MYSAHPKDDRKALLVAVDRSSMKVVAVENPTYMKILI